VSVDEGEGKVYVARVLVGGLAKEKGVSQHLSIVCSCSCVNETDIMHDN
jgi:hypothetical protein